MTSRLALSQTCVALCEAAAVFIMRAASGAPAAVSESLRCRRHRRRGAIKPLADDESVAFVSEVNPSASPESLFFSAVTPVDITSRSTGWISSRLALKRSVLALCEAALMIIMQSAAFAPAAVTVSLWRRSRRRRGAGTPLPDEQSVAFVSAVIPCTTTGTLSWALRFCCGPGECCMPSTE